MKYMKTRRYLLISSLALSIILMGCSSRHESSSDVPSSSDSIVGVTDGENLNTLYGGYYSSLSNWNDGADLIKKLHDIISSGSYKAIQYNGTYTNWMSNQNADKDIYDREFLDVIYSNDDVDPNATNSGWQREHAWPASLLTGKTTGDAVKTVGRATDFHNLFAASSSGNTSRGNKNYGNANTSSSSFADKDFANGGYRYDEKNFEPANKDKGRVSRAIFYMATMYSEDELNADGSVLYKGLKIQEEYVNYSSSTTYNDYAIGNLSTLLDWSKTAVDLLEYQHNESVYSYVPVTHSTSESNVAQGNRNPFVDFPGLVDYAFGSKKNQAGSMKDVASSYKTLDVSNLDIRTIVSAKRSYDVGSSFSKNDIVIGKFDKDMAITTDSEWNISGVTDGEVLNTIGSKTVTITTKSNTLTYNFDVKNADPFVSSTYTYTLTGKASGGDLSGIASKPATDNEVTLNGVTWIFRYEKGAIGSRSSTYGVAFGTGSAPVETLTIRSKDAFSYAGKNLVESIHLKGAAASGCSYAVSMYIGGSLVSQSQLGYTNGETKVVSASTSPKEGEVKFVITNINKACYVHSLAVNLK